MTALDQAWAEWMQPKGPTGKRSQGENWRIGNKDGEWPLLLAYRNGGPRPTSLIFTRTGLQMLYETDAWLGEQPVPPPPPPPGATARELFDAERDYGKPFTTIFDLVQMSNGTHQVQGKSRMADGDWVTLPDGTKAIRFSSPGFPSGTSPTGQPWYERVQMGWNRAITIGERCCYAIEFIIPDGQDAHKNDLAWEAPHVEVGGFTPPHCLYVVQGGVQYRLASGKTGLPAPVFECNTVGAGKAISPGMQWAIPAARFATGVKHLVLVEQVLTPQPTGSVDVWHKTPSLPWAQTVSLRNVPTLQCQPDAQRTVPSLNVADLMNLYVIATPVYKERLFTRFGRWDNAAEAFAELA